MKSFRTHFLIYVAFSGLFSGILAAQTDPAHTMNELLDGLFKKLPRTYSTWTPKYYFRLEVEKFHPRIQAAANHRSAQIQIRERLKKYSASHLYYIHEYFAEVLQEANSDVGVEVFSTILLNHLYNPYSSAYPDRWLNPVRARLALHIRHFQGQDWAHELLNHQGQLQKYFRYGTEHVAHTYLREKRDKYLGKFAKSETIEWEPLEQRLERAHADLSESLKEGFDGSLAYDLVYVAEKLSLIRILLARRLPLEPLELVLNDTFKDRPASDWWRKITKNELSLLESAYTNPEKYLTE